MNFIAPLRAVCRTWPAALRLLMIFKIFAVFTIVGPMQAKAAFNPPSTIAGTVLDEKGETLPGVSITVKGTAKATVTDAQGKFQIATDNEHNVLVFSFIGYKSFETSVKNSKSLNISMALESKSLSDVLVVGYGTQTKAEFTGSAARVTGNSIRDMPVQSFDQALAGKATGVSIGQPNGVLNNAPVIRI